MRRKFKKIVKNVYTLCRQLMKYLKIVATLWQQFKTIKTNKTLFACEYKSTDKNRDKKRLTNGNQYACINYVSDTFLVTVPFFTSNSTIFKLNFNGNL